MIIRMLSFELTEWKYKKLKTAACQPFLLVYIFLEIPS